jgi:CHAT domain-containing protein
MALLARATAIDSQVPNSPNVVEATKLYRQSVECGIQCSPSQALETALVWAKWAISRCSWLEAAEAYGLGLSAHEKLLSFQVDRVAKESRLKRVQGLAAMASSCFARAQFFERAVEILERGRAVLHARKLNQGSSAPSFREIVRVAQRAPLVYLEDVDVGFALIVESSGTVRCVWLPVLTEEELNRRLGEYRVHYELRAQDRSRWRESLDSLCRWLWDAVIGPVVQELAPATTASIVAGGYLGMLPLHAAWCEDPSKTSGRRYALDAIAISYLPSAMAMPGAAPAAANSVLCVDAPEPVTAGILPFSADETKIVSSLFPESRIVRGHEATREIAIRELPHFAVTHLSCHGHADLANPLRSGFLMSGDEVLTLADLFHVDLNRVRLLVLSACETGLMGIPLPDEAVSLPSGMLQAGARAVISPLWAISSDTALLLVSRFYQLWRRQGLDPAEALRQAQIWVRDSTNQEKIADLGKDRALSTWLESREPSAHETADISAWAAFTYQGI